MKEKIKRIISSLLALLMIFSAAFTLTSCGGKDTEKKTSESEKEDDDSKKSSDAIKAAILKIEKKYLNDNGYTEDSDVAELIAKVMECAKKNQKLIDYYEEGDNCVYIDFNDGNKYIFQPTGKEEKLNPSKLKLFSCKGKPEEYPAQCKNIEDTFSDDSDTEDVTIDEIKGLKGSSFVVMNGRGGFSEKIHSFINTDIQFSEAKEQYSSDCEDGLLVESSNGKTIITAKFFEKYYSENDFKDAVVYIGTGDSAKDEYLSSVFADKGAAGVLGNSGMSTPAYGRKVIVSVFGYYSNGMSLEEAIEKAKADNAEFLNGFDSDILIFGNKETAIEIEEPFDWKKAYTDFIKTDKADRGTDRNYSYAFVEMDGFEYPLLLIYWSIEVEFFYIENETVKEAKTKDGYHAIRPHFNNAYSKDGEIYITSSSGAPAIFSTALLTFDGTYFSLENIVVGNCTIYGDEEYYDSDSNKITQEEYNSVLDGTEQIVFSE